MWNECHQNDYCSRHNFIIPQEDVTNPNHRKDGTISLALK
jgi:hypothetical protein